MRSISFPLAYRGLEGVNYRYLCNAKIGSYLRARREALGLTQAYLADKMGGLTNAAISSWESGRMPVPPQRYEDLMLLLNLDRGEWSKLLLRYTNPHLFELTFPGDDPELPDELAAMAPRQVFDNPEPDDHEQQPKRRKHRGDR